MTDLKKFVSLNSVLMLKMMNKEPIGKFEIREIGSCVNPTSR